MRNETSVILDEIKNGLKFDLTNSNNIEELKTIIKDKDISHILIDKKIYFEYEKDGNVHFFEHSAGGKCSSII